MLGGALAAAGAALLLATQPAVRPVASVPPPVEPSRLARDIHALSVAFHPRSYDDPARLERTADYIAAALASSGARVESQPVDVQGMHYRNVVARFGPDAGPVLVIGAHYDACRISDAEAGVTPGADDNASGVAALLELARLLGRNPPDRAVELVAYTLEEPPFFGSPDMGSAWHARSLRRDGREVALMLSLESLGYYSDAPGSQHYPVPGMRHLYGDRGDFVALVGRFGDFAAMRRAKALMSGASSLPVRSFNAPALVEGVDFSDHRSYWPQGYPALMVTDTAFLRNPHYHRMTDTADRLDPARLAQVVQGVHAVVRAY